MLRKVLQLFLCLGLWTTCAFSAGPADIAGSPDPDFRKALETWLADDDAMSLPALAALAALAADGNRAARLLLARIEITDRAPSAFVLGLDREQRNRLYRKRRENSLYYRGWIEIEKEAGDSFAAVLHGAGVLGIDHAAIHDLYAAGEREAAEHKIRKIAVDGLQQDRKLLAEFLGPDDEHAPYLFGFRYSHAGATTGQAALKTILGQLEGTPTLEIQAQRDADTRRAEVFVDIGYQAGSSVADYDSGGQHYEAITTWLLQAPGAVPIANLCRRSCGVAELNTCSLTAFGLVGGYYELIRFDSPLENLVSQTDFLASARAEGMVARRVASARSEAAVPVFDEAELKRRSACLAAAVDQALKL